ncbi:MAG: hypothetical protein R3B70_28490 [Polyangiaceae bacterium]
MLKEAPASVEEALSVADRLMYRVKKSGKNSVVYEESGAPVDPAKATGSAP